MKKAQLATLGTSAILSLGGTIGATALAPAALSLGAMLASTEAQATQCTNIATTTPTKCSVPVATFIVASFSFVGSNGSNLNFAEGNNGGEFDVCGAHMTGTGTKFGLTTNGGSMMVVTGTATGSSAITPTSGLGSGC